MKFFFDGKRRVKQQIMETIGLAQGTEDSDFQAEYAEYKGTVNSIRHLQNTMRAHIVATKKQHQAAAALSVELAAFHRGTTAADGAMALGQAHAELERVCLPAIERLYEEEVIAAADLLLWQVPEVEERVRLRKKLLLDKNSHQRKYESSYAQLEELQNQGSSGGLLTRRKSEPELSSEVATRGVKLEHSKAAVDEATEWCLTQFRALLDQRESGNVLGGPMAAFLACQRKMMSAGAAKLDRVRQFLDASKYDEILSTYETEFAKMQAASGNDLFSGFGENMLGDDGSNKMTACFGAPLPEYCPNVLLEAFEYLDTRNLLETEGLFRVPGSQDVVQELRDRYNDGETGVLERLECEPHDVAALIKRYLQDLPVSVIPQAFYDRVVAAALQRDDGDSLAALVADLPEPHVACLCPLLQFLYRVARRADVNKMSFVNLATCLAPTIIRAPSDESPAKMMNEMQTVISAFKTLIEQAKRYDLSSSGGSSMHRAPPPPPSSSMPPMPPMKENKHTSRMMSSNKQGTMQKQGSNSKMHSESTTKPNHGSTRRMSMRRDLSIGLF